MVGNKENPILIEYWFVEDKYGCVVDIEEINFNFLDHRIVGFIEDHHREGLGSRCRAIKGGKLISTSIIKEVLENGVVKTLNTYYKLGKTNRSLKISLEEVLEKIY